jgi:glycosyltransferase involved in cell wall biosynthesis
LYAFDITDEKESRMKFAIITHVAHITNSKSCFAYAPYVREMNIWSQYVDEIIVVAPKSPLEKTEIDWHYEHKNIEFSTLENFDVLSFKAILGACFKIPKNSWQIFKAMKKADHIHLRCPGNIGLLACVVQILFPNKTKTAKYAGNWDPKSKQPWTYKLQKWILNNTFLTRNIQVLVYGEWEGSSKNIKPFFTASYRESEKLPLIPKSLKEQIKFVFAGTLVAGKNPLYAIQLVENLFKKGYNLTLDLYGEGTQRDVLENYIIANNLGRIIFLKGNQNQEVVKIAYKNSHFVVLPSQSEGWPKAIAEGMFWGCVPIATAVSCVPQMLDFGKRGLLLSMTRELCSNRRSNLENDTKQIASLLDNESDFERTRNEASDWSRKYTLDKFEEEIEKLLE